MPVKKWGGVRGSQERDAPQLKPLKTLEGTYVSNSWRDDSGPLSVESSGDTSLSLQNQMLGP